MSKEDVVYAFQTDYQDDLTQQIREKGYVNKIDPQEGDHENPVHDNGTCYHCVANEEGKKKYVAEENEGECNHYGSLVWVLDDEMVQLNQIIILRGIPTRVLQPLQ